MRSWVLSVLLTGSAPSAAAFFILSFATRRVTCQHLRHCKGVTSVSPSDTVTAALFLPYLNPPPPPPLAPPATAISAWLCIIYCD